MANMIYCVGIRQFTLNACAVILTRRCFTLIQRDAMAQTVKLPRCWTTLLHVEASRAPECEGHVTAFSNEVLAGTWILDNAFYLLEILATYCEMLDTLRQVYDLFLIRDMLRRPGERSILLQHHNMLDANLFHLCNKLKLNLAVDVLCLHRTIYVQCTCRDISRRCFTLKQLQAVAQAVKLPKCWRTVLHVEATRAPEYVRDTSQRYRMRSLLALEVWAVHVIC